jgi:ATP-dependent helicase/DNAse subunit B
VPLKLVTGPANAAKAGEVLGGLRARLDEEPILVVPSFEDVEHAQRELAERGAVFGARVVRFAWLFDLIAARTGYVATVASDLQRDLLVEAAVQRVHLAALARSAEQPGFVRAAVRLVEELGRHMVEPARFTSALRQWAGEGPRRAYAADIAGIYSRYRTGLERAGLVDAELFAWRALDALRREPAAFGRNPVFAYGFDDFTPLELDAFETLARHAGVDVTVSLPYEPGHEAFRAIAPLHERLAAIADERVPLEAVSDHYAEESRPALHHLERTLFETDLGEPVDPAGAVVLHEAGGERAEVELAGARVLELLRGGMPPGEVAVVFRRPERYASMVEQVFDSYDIPFSINRSVPLRHTGLGRGLLALVRCAKLGGSADDLLTYLRTPGRLRKPQLADALEAEARRAGAQSADQARALWDAHEGNPPVEEIDRLAATEGLPAFTAELGRRLERLFAGPWRRSAPLLSGSELDDARAFRAAREALAELPVLLEAGPAPGLDHVRVHDVLAELPVRVGENPQPDRVQVARPGAIRARRFQAVLVCGLQEDEFPARAAHEPFLPDEDRMALAEASGLVLPLREDRLERERYLFYVCCSRAERQLVLSSRYCDEEGAPDAPSFFLEDVRDLFRDLPVRRRSLSDVTWKPEEAPTDAERARAQAVAEERVVPEPVGALRCPEALEELGKRDTFSAGALERFADCPVKWLVEDLLRPEALEPDAEHLVRGSYAHEVLNLTYARLRDRTGERRVTPDNLAEAERILIGALEELQSDFPVSPKQTRVRAAVRRLEFDLLRFLGHEAELDTRFEPELLEWEFEGVPIELGLYVKGRIDRVDTWNGHALVRDYKTGSSVDRYKVASWRGERTLQAPVYMLAIERDRGLKLAGGVYTPLGGKDRRSRGLARTELEDELGAFVHGNDFRGDDEFTEEMEEAKGLVHDVVERLKQGRLCSRPDTCAWDGGCSYPSICRVEQ